MDSIEDQMFLRYELLKLIYPFEILMFECERNEIFEYTKFGVKEQWNYASASLNII